MVVNDGSRDLFELYQQQSRAKGVKMYSTLEVIGANMSISNYSDEDIFAEAQRRKEKVFLSTKDTIIEHLSAAKSAIEKLNVIEEELQADAIEEFSALLNWINEYFVL